MEVAVARQTLVFFQSCVLGMAFGLLYDIFRITRVAFKLTKLIISLEDIFYFIICSAFTFFFIMSTVDGKLRIFIIIGEIIGAVLYYFTLGELVMGISRLIIDFIKTVIRVIKKYIVKPLMRLIYNIIQLIKLPFKILAGFAIKLFKNLKYGLKTRRIILYNQIIIDWKRKDIKKRDKRCVKQDEIS